MKEENEDEDEDSAENTKTFTANLINYFKLLN